MKPQFLSEAGIGTPHLWQALSLTCSPQYSFKQNVKVTRVPQKPQNRSWFYFSDFLLLFLAHVHVFTPLVLLSNDLNMFLKCVYNLAFCLLPKVDPGM